MKCNCGGYLKYEKMYGDGYYEPIERIYSCCECGKYYNEYLGELTEM